MNQENSTAQILVIEDEPDIQELLEYNLKRAGYTVLLASDGQSGLSLAQKHIPDLILLDLMLPEIDGFSICKTLREQAKTRHIPVIIITAKSEESDTIHGLDLGADDYVVKPFKTQELLARIKAHLRRYELYRSAATKPSSFNQENYNFGPLTLDRQKHIIFLNKQPLILTLSEFKLLAALITSPGQVFSRSLMDVSKVVLTKRIIHVPTTRKKARKVR